VLCELDQNDLLPALRQQEAALHVAEAASRVHVRTMSATKSMPRVATYLSSSATWSGHKNVCGKLIAQNTRDDTERTIRSRCKNRNRQWPIWARGGSHHQAQAALEQQQATLSQAEENLRNANHRVAHGWRGAVARQRVGTAVSSSS